MCERCERNARARDAATELRPPGAGREETAREAEVRIYGPLTDPPPLLLLLALRQRAKDAARPDPSQN